MASIITSRRIPQVRPRVLTRFEPWMALSFTEGSIGGDIERISLSELASFYGGAPVAQDRRGAGHPPARAARIERHRLRARATPATATPCC